MASKKAKKKKQSLFYPIYFSVLLLAIVAILVVCGRLTPYLADFEKSNPKYAADDAMRFFSQGDMSGFYESASDDQFNYEDRDDYIAWLSSYIEGGTFTYREVRSADDGMKKYEVSMKGEPFGAFYLREVPNSTAYGFSTWEYDHLDAPRPEAVTYEVLAPSDATVWAGSQHLTEADAVETGIATVWSGYMLKEETPDPTMTRYRFSRCFGCPQITAADSLGPCAVTGDERSGFVVERNYDAALQAETEERVKTIVEAFSKFIANDFDRDTMLQRYVRDGTNAHEIIKTFDNNWFGQHDSATVTNLQTMDYIRFTDDTMACRVHYDFVVKSSKGEASYDTNYWFYFVLRNGEWYLYDFFSIL